MTHLRGLDRVRGAIGASGSPAPAVPGGGVIVQFDRMAKSLGRRWAPFLATYGLISLAADLFPTFGPPHFRYTGSDPAVHVWNLGWPVATAIYDSRSGIHVEPFAIMLVGGVQVGLLALIAAAAFFRKPRPSASANSA